MDMPQALAALRPQMLRSARAQLNSEAAAEDAVQEALLAAMVGAAGFNGAATLKTWAFSILRNKIVDDIRRRSREPESPLSANDDDLEVLLFPSDHRAGKPDAWADPESSLEQRQFWTVFEGCLEDVPAKTGRVFVMREVLGFSTEEICGELGITAANCWVLLHRARLALRESMAQRWLGNPPSPVQRAMRPSCPAILPPPI